MNYKFLPVKKIRILHYFSRYQLSTSKGLIHFLTIKNKADTFTRQEANMLSFLKVYHF